LTPYLHKYISQINRSTTEVDVLSWDKFLKKETLSGCNIISYSKSVNNKSFISKVVGYYGYSRFIKRLLKKNNYDGVVFLQTRGSLLVKKLIMKKYKGKFIIDVRDYTYENKPFIKKAIGSIFDNSWGVVISSEGYKSFLPERDYILVHNSPNLKVTEVVRNEKAASTPLVISYIGLIRFYDQCILTIERFKNDERFSLKFIGAGSSFLENYCKKNKINNVETVDYFEPSKTLEFYNNSDIVFNLYGNNSPFLDYALSNKLYYAALLNKPILVSPNTYMEKLSKEYGFGLTVDLNDPLCANKLFFEYYNIDFLKLGNSTTAFMTKVSYDNKVFEEFIQEFYANV
jgi:hypothetical protein